MPNPRWVGLFAVAALLAASLAAPVISARAAAVPGDPRVGPHARDEARHKADPVRFNPARTGILPRQIRRASRAVAVPSAPSLEDPLSVVPAPLMADGPVSLQAAALATNGGGLSREVFGFAPYWALAANANWNYSLLSTVAYFGLDLNADGSVNQTTRGWTGWTSQDLVDTINRAHGAGDRVVVVIKTFDEATINQIVTTPAATQLAINNTMSAIASKSLDGVNVDFEGYASSSYPNIQSGFTNFMTQLSAQVHHRWPAAMVSADTYSGAASWDNGIFNIGALAPVVDAFFVMAYDMNFSNLPGQAGPNAPLNGWTYNDTTAVAQYLGKAPASKIILGVPYYGYKYSVTTPPTSTPPPYATTTGGATADSYAGVLDDFACALQLSKQWDGTAQSPWAYWWSPASGDPCGGNHNSWRELYYDDARSLGLKYDLVNAKNLRGTGMWALGYDGTSTDLWRVLALKFVYPFKAMYTLDGYGGLSADAGSAGLGGADPWPGWRIARSVALLPDASGGYILDGYGGLTAVGAASRGAGGELWPGWDIARDVVLLPNATAGAPQGYILDGYGGLTPLGSAPAARTSGYWAGQDIAKRVAVLGDGSGGYVLDAYGGLHPFAVGSNPLPPGVRGGSWPGWAIARDLALSPDSTASQVAGVVLDGYGGLSPFGTAGSVTPSAYWRGQDLGRAVRLSPTSTAAFPAGWVLDGSGGIHAFGGVPPVTPAPSWPGQDIAVQLVLR